MREIKDMYYEKSILEGALNNGNLGYAITLLNNTWNRLNNHFTIYVENINKDTIKLSFIEDFMEVISEKPLATNLIGKNILFSFIDKNRLSHTVKIEVSEGEFIDIDYDDYKKDFISIIATCVDYLSEKIRKKEDSRVSLLFEGWKTF